VVIVEKNKMTSTPKEILAEYEGITEPYKVECMGLSWWILPGVFDPTKGYAGQMFAEVAMERPHRRGRILNMGCGCGTDAVISAGKNEHVTAVDINQRAVVNTQINAGMHGVSDRMDIYESDLFMSVPQGQCFDFIYFNGPFLSPLPPAVSDVSTTRGGIEISFFDKNYELMKTFLEIAPSYLAKNGGVIISAATLNGSLDSLVEYTGEFGYKRAVLKKRKNGGEEIYVMGLSPEGSRVRWKQGGSGGEK
jgi:methylase of polypeptide subunit release factors